MTTTLAPTRDELLAILADNHPTTIKVLGAFHDEPITPTDAAARVGLPLENTSYHVRKLAACGVLRKVRTRRRGNLTASYYVRAALAEDEV